MYSLLPMCAERRFYFDFLLCSTRHDYNETYKLKRLKIGENVMAVLYSTIHFHHPTKEYLHI